MSALFIRRRGGSAAPGAAAEAIASAPAEVAAERDRLAQRFAVLQSELGGLFYEMAIRDHIRMEPLMERAAELQRLDGQLGAIERILEDGSTAVGGHCNSCGSVYARAAAFCGQCGAPVTA